MIEFDQVSLALGSFRLNDVSLTINRGDYYFIVGPSGAGKTVILEAIAGLHRPRRGRILLRGEEVTSLPPEKRRVALVYQDYSLFPHMSVIDNVGYGLRMQGMGRADARREVAGLLTEFGIAHLADRYPGTLSGGEQQRRAALSPRSDNAGEVHPRPAAAPPGGRPYHRPGEPRPQGSAPACHPDCGDHRREPCGGRRG